MEGEHRSNASLLSSRSVIHWRSLRDKSRPELPAVRKSIVSLIRVVVVLLVSGFLLRWIFSHPFTRPVHSAPSQEPDEGSALRCRSLPGADQTLVVIKTGVTEFEQKLPVHIETTLQCYPNYLIYSDHNETFRGEDIHDALEPVDPSVKNSHPDFDFYRRVKIGGRRALEAHELSKAKQDKNRHPDDAAKLAMSGWRLDKWKFLPMWNETYYKFPNMRWYVFIEADTYMFWSQMLRYQAALDHTKPIYIGAELFMDYTLFAHGGAGILMSNPAMELYVDEYKAHYEQWESLVGKHWAGDIVLGRAMNAAGVTITPAWPLFHPHAVGNDTFYWAHDDRRFWCYPVISYHHVTPEVIGDLWRFEQDYVAEMAHTTHGVHGSEATLDPSGTRAMKRRDVFTRFTYGQMREPRNTWDNDSRDDRGYVASPKDCSDLCEKSRSCLQYRFDGRTGNCFTNTEAKWGDAAPGTQFRSGWMYQRIGQWIDDQIPCGNEGWILDRE